MMCVFVIWWTWYMVYSQLVPIWCVYLLYGGLGIWCICFVWCVYLLYGGLGIWCICFKGTRARMRERIRRVYNCVRTMMRLLKTCAHVCAYILTRVHKHARTRTHTQTQTHTTILILSICIHIHMTGYWAAGRGQDGGGVLDVQREGGCQNCRDDGTRGCRKNQNLCRRHGKIDR